MAPLVSALPRPYSRPFALDRGGVGRGAVAGVGGHGVDVGVQQQRRRRAEAGQHGVVPADGEAVRRGRRPAPPARGQVLGHRALVAHGVLCIERHQLAQAAAARSASDMAAKNATPGAVRSTASARAVSEYPRAACVSRRAAAPPRLRHDRPRLVSDAAGYAAAERPLGRQGDRRALPAARAHRRGRHGRGLPGRAHPDEEDGGHQAAARRAGPGGRGRAPLRARGPVGQPPEPPQHHRRHRLRPRRHRRVLPGDGVRARALAGRRHRSWPGGCRWRGRCSSCARCCRRWPTPTPRAWCTAI